MYIILYWVRDPPTITPNIPTGKSEEEANELACLGADDMMPISIYIMTRAATPELISELQFLYDATHEE